MKTLVVSTTSNQVFSKNHRGREILRVNKYVKKRHKRDASGLSPDGLLSFKRWDRTKAVEVLM